MAGSTTSCWWDDTGVGQATCALNLRLKFLVTSTEPKNDAVNDELKALQRVQMQCGNPPGIVRFRGEVPRPAGACVPVNVRVLQFDNGAGWKGVFTGREDGRIEPGRQRLVLLQLLHAMLHLHAAGVFHRDTKPSNVLLTTGGAVKLADFGLSCLKSASVETRSLCVGTRSFIAPELLEKGGVFTEASDVWELGVTCYVLMTRQEPLENHFELYERIPMDGVDTRVASVIRQMTRFDPKQRMKLNDACKALGDIDIFVLRWSSPDFAVVEDLRVAHLTNLLLFVCTTDEQVMHVVTTEMQVTAADKVHIGAFDTLSTATVDGLCRKFPRADFRRRIHHVPGPQGLRETLSRLLED
jgi:serine/threonine protein kinase